MQVRSTLLYNTKHVIYICFCAGVWFVCVGVVVCVSTYIYIYICVCVCVCV